MMRKTNITLITVLLFTCICISNLSAQNVSTVAGSTQGFVDGTTSNAKFNLPNSVAVDLDDNIYVSDAFNHRIRKITPEGIVTTIAGSTQGYADGNGTSAKFNTPIDLTVDAEGTVFVADHYNNRIRKITQDGVVTTLAGSTSEYLDGNGITAKFKQPSGITMGIDGSLIITDTGNNRIRKVTMDGNVTTIAGSDQGFADGIATSAKFYHPFASVQDNMGNIFVSDAQNHRIRKISPDGNVTTFAGSAISGYTDGTGNLARFAGPYGIDIDLDGNLYVADHWNFRIRKITPAGMVSTVAGSSQGFLDGDVSIALFNYINGLKLDNSGNILVADVTNNRIRKVTGLLEVSEFELHDKSIVFYDPISKALHIKADNVVISEISLFDTNGRNVAHFDISTINLGFVGIGNLTSGLYLV